MISNIYFRQFKNLLSISKALKHTESSVIYYFFLYSDTSHMKMNILQTILRTSLLSTLLVLGKVK